MKGIVSVFLCLCSVGIVWAGHTRMDILMAGDYLDDIININTHPHHIAAYTNQIYGDITERIDAYGIIITHNEKYGAFALWQNPDIEKGFHIGYGIRYKKFDLGLIASPVENHGSIGFGVGRAFFNRHFDLSFLVGEDRDIDWSKLTLRVRNRTGDYVIVPKYTGTYFHEPREYYNHRIGVLIQRLVFDGFVFLGAEWDFTRGDIEDDYGNIYAGLEMPVSRKVVLLLGIRELISDDFEALTWQIEPGFRVRIKDFAFDFHINTDTIFEDDEFTLFIFNSFGIELNFGKF